MRACWIAAPAPPEPGARTLVPVGPGLGDPTPRRTFVPVEPAGAVEPTPATAPPPALGTTDAAVGRAAPISPATGVGGRVPGTWWLWGDPEPWPEL
jgi:hypothetical protein